MEAVPTPSVQVIASALDMISVHYPQAKQTDPNLIVDPSFVRRIDQSGFISALYKNNSQVVSVKQGLPRVFSLAFGST